MTNDTLNNSTDLNNYNTFAPDIVWIATMLGVFQTEVFLNEIVGAEVRRLLQQSQYNVIRLDLDCVLISDLHKYRTYEKNRY